MNKQLKLNWNDRFAVIDHFTPTDEQIRTVFGLNQDELDTARTLRSNGTFAANTSLDVNKYSKFFKNTSTPSQTVHASVSSTKSTATVHAKPETATKKVKVPQKRGRKGNRIEMALRSVTETPVLVDTFMKQHNVSLAVLRQSKRFIQTLDPVVASQIGTIDVRQDKTTKQLMVSRRK
jgi:hypothetical protein